MTKITKTYWGIERPRIQMPIEAFWFGDTSWVRARDTDVPRLYTSEGVAKRYCTPSETPVKLRVTIEEV